MIEKIDHIGIAVKSVDATLLSYERMYGLKPLKVELLRDINVRLAFIRVGEVMVELMEPIEPGKGRIGEFVEQRGEGFHHIAYRVDDLGRTMRELDAMGCPLRDRKPRPGGDNSWIAFIEPGVTQNVLTELVERKGEIQGEGE